MASASEDELAHLSGEELARRLANTHSRSDFDVAARIFGARDRRNAMVEAELSAALADLEAASARESGDAEVTGLTAELEAALAELDAMREKYKALQLLNPFLRPQYEVEEMTLMVRAASPDESRVEEAKIADVKSIDIVDLCSDEEEEERAAGGCEEEEDEEDTESLSQRAKRLRRVEPGELESGKGDVRGLSDSVATLGNDQQISSSVKIEVPVATTGKMISKPEGSKVAAFVQESPVVKTQKFDVEMPKTMLLPSQGLLGRSTIQEDGSSKSNYCKAGIGEEGRSSDGVPARGVSQPSKGIVKIDKTPTVESSAKCGNKEVGAEKCASLPRLSEEPRITRVVVPSESCNENNTNVQVKREMMSLLPSTVTSKWVTEAGIVISMLDHNLVEVHMQALCALYRQGKLAHDDKRKEVRANKLAEFLLDGDRHGPMKRTAQELKKPDDAAFIGTFAFDLSGKLFDIFRYKEDPYFC
ncbi:unnamed protein product [Alopecurus aequalis]